ncbi:MAG: UDP binding domain-containing protein, partial [Aestuariibaculum sp.]
TKVVDVIHELESYNTNITIYDPWANPEEVMHEYKLETTTNLPTGKFDAIVLTVAHSEFLSKDLPSLLTPKGILYDVKGTLTGSVQGRL